jgi:hypothetical protein
METENESHDHQIPRRTGPACRCDDPRPSLWLKILAGEAYQPERYATDLNFEEAARRIDALKAEIALADSF